MASQAEVTVRLAPDSADLANALDVIAKHARACAAELRALRIPAPPTMEHAADGIARAARDHVLDPRNDVL